MRPFPENDGYAYEATVNNTIEGGADVPVDNSGDGPAQTGSDDVIADVSELPNT